MNYPESKLQQACVRWFRYQYPTRIIYAIPNGGKRKFTTGSILRAEGLLSGVPDLFIAEPMGDFHGMYIEMKKGSGKQTPAQMDMEEKLINRGYLCSVCRTFEEFEMEVSSYFRLKENLNESLTKKRGSYLNDLTPHMVIGT